MKTIIKKNLNVSAVCKNGIQYVSPEYAKELRNERRIAMMMKVHLLSSWVDRGCNISTMCQRYDIKHHYSKHEIWQLEHKYFNLNMTLIHNVNHVYGGATTSIYHDPNRRIKRSK